MSGSPELRLAPCSREAARYAVEHWHYSKRMPVGKLTPYGVWEGERFIGAVVFGRGGTSAIGKPYALDQTAICELVRVALTKHSAPVTKIVAVALKLLRRANPGLRLVVSYADPAQGHVGTIYQAGGWLFVGEGGGDVFYRTPGGRLVHSRVVSPTGYNRQFGELRRCWRKDEVTPVRMPGKLKYLLPLDDAMRAQIEPLRQLPPKRESPVRGVNASSA
jgi:hypothetical protein